ncbi:DNA methyltransferase [Clostridium botulinum]|uniref:DNA cytosine methyltransferase n=1 Tax=Clostridium botulinum TaxID=1491 RepID=UPI000596EA43|nr:DNA cytosine methyltransferase [Clostridium botulinum]KIL07561.1 DNA methyltransferase [Clostridium botulinum]MBY6935449.1 DNA cytosine methyltransferase [Clostridium botulinum]NFL82242.1 DNA cytosine methyltransferase [Clostridium botulinum]NFN12611.1 DNA cytosine methyltransferase [Clostridium botulinum]NFO37777.1 DNA cytosine methyltransferase [Clostridium botulinum]
MKKAICLFSSAGIGELGIKSNNIDILISNEIVKNRHKLYSINYSDTKCFTGDIWEEKKYIIDYYIKNFENDELFLIYATPPCQGMSSIGAGKLLSEIRKGNRKSIDERNRLIIPTIDIIKNIRPKWIILENVENMQNTIINDENNDYINIMEYIDKNLRNEYVGKGEVINCADYGIPQTRRRLITIYTRDKNGKKYFNEHKTFFPDEEKTHKNNWVTLRDAIGNLPPLEAIKGKESRFDVNPYYYVPIMNEKKYWWLSNTKEGDTAFNNQCVNQECMYQGNKLHGSNTEDGQHKSNKDTPIYCERCGKLLPRPTIVDKKTNELRLIKGYDSSYRRMEWDKPAGTLTQNFQFEASDKKVHPNQTRVLSIYEALILQTINQYKYDFQIGNKPISKTMFTEIIGESVPPKLIDIICEKIISITDSGKIR